MTQARFDKAVVGDAYSKHLRASNWNMVREATLRVLNDRSAIPSKGREILRPALTKVTNGSGARVEPKSILALSDIAIPVSESDSEEHLTTQPMFQGVAPMGMYAGRFAAVASEAETDENVVAYGAGIISVKLFVPSNGDWIDRADLDPTDGTRLVATPNGSAQILWKDAGTNATVDAIVRLGNPQFVALTGKTLLQLDPDTQGTIEVWNNDVNTNYPVSGVWLDWMHGDQPISADKEVLFAWFPHENGRAGRWRVIGAECEDVAAPVEFGTLSQSGSDVFTMPSVTPAIIDTYDQTSGGDSGWGISLNDPSAGRITVTAVGNYRIEGAFGGSFVANNSALDLWLYLDDAPLADGLNFAQRTGGDTGYVYWQSDPFVSDGTPFIIDMRLLRTAGGGSDVFTIEDATLRVVQV